MPRTLVPGTRTWYQVPVLSFQRSVTVIWEQFYISSGGTNSLGLITAIVWSGFCGGLCGTRQRVLGVQGYDVCTRYYVSPRSSVHGVVLTAERSTGTRYRQLVLVIRELIRRMTHFAISQDAFVQGDNLFFICVVLCTHSPSNEKMRFIFYVRMKVHIAYRPRYQGQAVYPNKPQWLWEPGTIVLRNQRLMYVGLPVVCSFTKTLATLFSSIFALLNADHHATHSFLLFSCCHCVVYFFDWCHHSYCSYDAEWKCQREAEIPSEIACSDMLNICQCLYPLHP